MNNVLNGLARKFGFKHSVFVFNFVVGETVFTGRDEGDEIPRESFLYNPLEVLDRDTIGVLLNSRQEYFIVVLVVFFLGVCQCQCEEKS